MFSLLNLDVDALIARVVEFDVTRTSVADFEAHVKRLMPAL